MHPHHTNMKIFVFGIVVALSCAVYGVSPEYKELFKGYIEECKSTHSIESSQIKDAISQKKLPETESGKCFMACVLTKIGMIKDGKLDTEKTLELNKMKFTDPENLEKANEVTKRCADVKAENECDLAIELTKCAIKNAKELNLNVSYE